MKQKILGIISTTAILLSLFFSSIGPCHASGYPVTITDSDGRKIVIKSPFARIISLYPAHTENLVSLGAGDTLVGISRSSRSIKGIPRGCKTVGYRDDLERLLALKPDLVIIRPMISRAHPNLVRGLEKSGITVVSLQPVSPDGLYAYWRKLGQLTGRQKEAEDMVKSFKKGVEEMRQKVATIPIQKRPRVYFEAIHRRMKTFAPGSFQIFCLESAGGINIASDAQRIRNTNIATYGKERILAKANQIDVFLAQKGRMNPVTRQDILNEPGFQVIKAIREGRIYLVDETIVSRPTLRLLQGMRQIFEILYPDKKRGGLN